MKQTSRHDTQAREYCSGRSARAFVTSCLCAFLLFACGHPKGVIFEPPKTPMSWPPPPEPARIHYVGSIATEADLKPAKSFGKALGEAFFGKDPVRSMLSPYALCTDGGSRLFVCDSNAQTVHVFNLETRAYQQWKPDGEASEPKRQTVVLKERETDKLAEPVAAPVQPPGAPTGFSQPVGIAFDARPDRMQLFVSDSVAGVVFVFNDAGHCTGAIGQEFLTRPCGLAIDPRRDRLYVADAATHQVFALDFNGNLIDRVGVRGIEAGQFNYPTNVAVDSNGRLYVSDTLNFRVQVFDENLQPIRHIGSHGDMPGYFSQPKGLALDSENHLYVVDARFETVQIFDSDGNFLLAFGEEGGKAGQFWLPAGIFIDASDRIWIADSYNRRVQVFEYRPEVRP